MGQYHWWIFIVAGLEADLVVFFHENAFEGGFVGVCHSDEAVVAIADFGLGREYYYVALAEFWFHRIAYHRYSKGVRVMEVWAADVVVGDTCGVVFIVVVYWVASSYVVYDGY